MVKYAFIIIFSSSIGITALHNPFLVFKDEYYKTQAKNKRIIKNELSKESKTPDFKFIGQAMIALSAYLFIKGIGNDEDGRLFINKQLWEVSVGSLAVGTLTIFIEKNKQSHTKTDSNYTLDDKIQAFLLTFCNRRLLAKKLFNIQDS